MRIFCCGPGGTGKTTLCEWASLNLDIPYLNTSGRQIWGQFGIKSHDDLIKKCKSNVQFGIDYQHALLDVRERVYKEADHFITERSVVDNAVYFLIEVAPHTSYNTTMEYLERCRQLSVHIDGLINFRYNPEMPVEDDGARVANAIFTECSQLYFDYVMDNHLQRLKPGNRKLDIFTTNFTERTKTTQLWLEMLQRELSLR